MKKWVTHRTILLLLLILLVFVLVASDLQGTWGLNKTVGWAWDLSNLQWWWGVLVWIGFILGYALLAVFRIATDLVLSSIQLITFIGSLFFLRFYSFDPSWGPGLVVLTNVIFVINLAVSLRRRFLGGNGH